MSNKTKNVSNVAVDEKVNTVEQIQVTDLAVINLTSAGGLETFNKQIENINNLPDAVGVLNNFADNTRNLWIATALVVKKAMNKYKAKERAQAVKDLENILKYKKSQIYNFQTAGTNILQGKKIENLSDCFSVNDYLKLFKEKIENNEIIQIERIGEFSLDDEKFYFYKGELLSNKGEKELTRIITFYSDNADLVGRALYNSGDEYEGKPIYKLKSINVGNVELEEKAVYFKIVAL